MSSTFLYAVFRNATDFSNALADLKRNGMEDVVVMKNTADSSYRSAVVQNNLKSQFVKFGAVGAVVGGLAGAVASPTVPFQTNYQLITPMMSMVSGAILCAYFAVWICGFLNWVDRPILEHEVFEGSIESGSMLLGVTTEDAQQRHIAIKCFDDNSAVELIVRASALPAIEPAQTPSSIQINIPENVPRLVA